MRRQYDPLSLLLFFYDGRGRSWREDSGRLRLLIQSLQQRVQFLLQDTTLGKKNTAGETGHMYELVRGRVYELVCGPWTCV